MFEMNIKIFKIYLGKKWDVFCVSVLLKISGSLYEKNCL